jgi:N-acetylmuramoyl-L-alanine amidase
MIRAKNIIPPLLMLFLCLQALDANAGVKILNVRHWVAPDHTRVVIDTSDEPEFVVEKTREKILVDFKETVVPGEIPYRNILNKPGIKSISWLQLPPQTIRVEILLADHVDSSVFKLKRFEEKPDRIVIDIELPEVEQRETREREEVKTQRKNKIIVIDPGHGGEDPGAIGLSGTQEKDVVLKIGKKLRDVLNKKEGYRAFLTRSGDYYVPFNKRLKIAREYGADLFLSIHADAARQRSARGFSVYCLSTGAASSEAAKLLARKENLADIIGGSPNGESSDESDPIVLNMFQTNTLNVSKTYAKGVLRNMKSVLPLKFNTVQGAPFRVLKLPEIPSLLVETAYISNKTEERLLSSSRYQKQIAEALAGSIMEFLPLEPAGKPSPAVQVTKKEIQAEPVGAVKDADRFREKMAVDNETVKSPDEKILIYKVRKGESLERIARRHDVTLSSLLKLNKMKLDDPLLAGRKIKIAVAEKKIEESRPEPRETIRTADKAPRKNGNLSSDQKPDITVYKAREGDSLDKIARRHGTTLGALLKINKMKINEPLSVGRVVKLKEMDGDREEPSTRASGARAVKTDKYTYYRVKKGETLELIARRNGTTIQNLQQLNRMKPSDPLLANKKLKLPQNPPL